MSNQSQQAQQPSTQQWKSILKPSPLAARDFETTLGKNEVFERERPKNDGPISPGVGDEEMKNIIKRQQNYQTTVGKDGSFKGVSSQTPQTPPNKKKVGFYGVDDKNPANQDTDGSICKKF